MTNTKQGAALLGLLDHHAATPTADRWLRVHLEFPPETGLLSAHLTLNEDGLPVAKGDAYMIDPDLEEHELDDAECARIADYWHGLSSTVRSLAARQGQVRNLPGETKITPRVAALTHALLDASRTVLRTAAPYAEHPYDTLVRTSSLTDLSAAINAIDSAGTPRHDAAA